jgi:anthranilate phosphoribosyltransferase
MPSSPEQRNQADLLTVWPTRAHTRPEGATIPPMSIAPYIKEIGRGKEGARSLTADQAHDLFSQVLDGTVTDLEVGAFALAMRIKGETVDELDGFVRSTLARCLPLPAPQPHGSGVVVLPSYNGSRKLPNLTTLLAGQLARSGVAVLVHGPLKDPTRVTTAEVFETLGWSPAQSAENLTQHVAQAWLQRLPAFVDIHTLCPGLGRLLDVRWTIGLRNPGHTVAKLLSPFAAGVPTVRVVNHTHPEYAISLKGYLAHTQANALLMRGTEGEPVADARRQPRFDVYLGGVLNEALSRQPQDGVLTDLPDLPDTADATATATYINAVLKGERALPASIGAQAQCLRAALAQAESGA